jgi:hypothetical protein
MRVVLGGATFTFYLLPFTFLPSAVCHLRPALVSDLLKRAA